MTDKPNNVHKRGFASMTPERRREIAAKGGASLRPEQRSFSQNRKLAREAGAKGGSANGKGKINDTE